MLHLPALPRSVRTLRDDEREWLELLNPAVPRSPQNCITCGGSGRFRWYRYASDEFDPGDDPSEIDEFECNCRDQWVLSRFLLMCGVKDRYQRFSWHDVEAAEPAAVKTARQYLEHASEYVAAGIGLIFHGELGTGKTLLASLVVKGLIAQGHLSYFTTSAEMIDMVKTSWRREDERIRYQQRIRHVTVLAVDELGAEQKTRTFTDRGMRSETSNVTEYGLDDVLRHRVASSMPTIVTSNLDLETIGQHYGAGIVSLLQECSASFHFRGVSYREKERNRLIDEVDAGLRRPVVLS